MAVNLRGVFLCCRGVVPHMKQQGGGKMVNISSGTVFFSSLKRSQTPEDLVGTAIFLCSSESNFMTGQTLVVDGDAQMH